MTHRRRSSPLHAARAVVGAAWCVVVAVVALSFEHPAILVTLLGAVVAAGLAARVGDAVLRALTWGVPVALLWMLVNAVVQRDGATVIFRGGEVPLLGRLDVTAEATLYGGVLGLRALIVIASFGLYAAAVDPDDLLRAFRRISLRSALTAALATRMVPVLARDGRRMLDAQRCRGGEEAPRRAVIHAVAVNALDRAVDVAATLELRGYGTARRAPRAPRPWSRHDLAFSASAVVLALLGGVGEAAGWDPFDAVPRTHAPLTAGVAALCLALAAAALAPFTARRGTG